MLAQYRLKTRLLGMAEAPKKRKPPPLTKQQRDGITALWKKGITKVHLIWQAKVCFSKSQVLGGEGCADPEGSEVDEAEANV